MTWITDDELKSKLLTCLQKAGLEEENSWDEIITDANQSAADYISGALASRGYTAAQVRGWDAARTYNIDIGLFWCLIKGGVTKAYDETFIKELDRRLELATADVVIDGELVVPGTSTSRRVSSGMLKNDTDLLPGDVRPWRTRSRFYGCEMPWDM